MIAMQTRVSQIDGKWIAQDSQHRDRLSGAGPNRSKSRPGRSFGVSQIERKSIAGASPDGRWRPRAFQELFRGVLAASWDVSGAPRERPRAPQEPKASARERLGARRDNQNRCQVVSGSEKSLFFWRNLSAKLFRSSLSMTSGRFSR